MLWLGLRTENTGLKSIVVRLKMPVLVAGITDGEGPVSRENVGCRQNCWERPEVSDSWFWLHNNGLKCLKVSLKKKKKTVAGLELQLAIWQPWWL